MMRAAVVHDTGRPFVIEERPLPAIGPTDLLIRVERCGICGSDLHMFDEPPQTFPGGMMMGHEFAGIIVDKGSAVRGHREGERVAVYPATGCGACAACARGNPILCPQAKWVTGGYAEFARVPAEAAILLPAELTALEGALVEPLTVGLYGVRIGGVGEDDRVLVLGGGSIALAAIYWSKRLGAGRVVTMSRSPRRAALAHAMGSDGFVCAGDGEKEAVTKILGGAPTVVIECVGAVGMLQQAVDHCGLFGRVISLGLGIAPDPVSPTAAGMKGVSLHFPVGYSHDDFHEVARSIRTGPVDPTIMVSPTIRLDDLPQRFAALLGDNAETKVQISMTEAVEDSR